MTQRIHAEKLTGRLAWVSLRRLVFLRSNPQILKPHELEALKESIARDGFLCPILVRRRGPGYEILSGNHRVMAAQELGLKRIPAYIVEMDDARALRVLVNLNTAHGQPRAELLAPFLAELDGKSLRGIYLSAELQRGSSQVAQELYKSFRRLRVAKGWNQKSPRTPIVPCICPTCGRRHIRGAPGKARRLQTSETNA